MGSQQSLWMQKSRRKSSVLQIEKSHTPKCVARRQVELGSASVLKSLPAVARSKNQVRTSHKDMDSIHDDFLMVRSELK
jgi:hypothetical protein